MQTGTELRDNGMKQATDHANRVIPAWSTLAYHFLLNYIKTVPGFMTEDVRRASAGQVPEPPSNRAWGSIVVRAKKAGVIIPDGFRSVTNPKAHATPATYWRVV